MPNLQLHEALDQISEIRRRIAHAETFRGYRSATAGFSAFTAFAAAALQAMILPRPWENTTAYFTLWCGTAVLCVVAVGVEMTVRCLRTSSELALQSTRVAVEQFLPCLVAGMLTTAALCRAELPVAAALPGIWSILFSLGVFASCRVLPRQVIWIGAYYLIAGSFCLALARGEAAFSPWAMAATFGVGQAAAAAVLYFTLERDHD